MTTRRQFLRSSSLVSLAATPPAFLTRAARASRTDKDGRVLVVVQLAGGNDGLNTVVPYADEAYRKARPGIGLAPGAVLKIDDSLGFHPAMGGMKELFDEGALAVVQGVGYPNPDRSHFRSMDIWNSAQPEVEVPDDGWLGRALDHGGDTTPGAVGAMALGTSRLPLALVSAGSNVPTVRDLESYRLAPGTGGRAGRDRRVRQLQELSAASAGGSPELAFLRQVSAHALISAARIEEAATAYRPAAEYPGTRLAQQLKTVAQLISGDLGTRIFFVSLGGFDTHSQQLGAHAALLAELSGAVRAFFEDLAGQSLADRVMLATYSEFGRRVEENGSLGTDHGAASPLFLASPALRRAGLCGRQPSLTELDPNGDLAFGIDFRSVYSTLLEDWLGIRAVPVLGGKFDKLPLV